MPHKIKKLYFFSQYCLLRNTTNRIFDMRMCDAFAGNGVEVTFVHPYVYMKENIKSSEIHKLYGMENSFKVRMQYTPMWETMNNRLMFIVWIIAFTFSAIRVVLGNIGNLKNVVIMSREVVAIMPILVIKKILGPLCPVIVVPHLDEIKGYSFKRWAYNNASGIMPVVSSIRDALMREEGLPIEKFCVMYAPVADFTKTDCSKEEARKKIKYDSNIPVVIYTGKVGLGVEELYYILDAAALLPQYNFMFTGGKDAAVNKLRSICTERGIKNVIFTGFFIDSTFVRYYQLAADVLVSYYTAKDHPVEYNFPQKLQEYISTHNPVVTPDFAATRDIITKDNAFFVEPDNPKSLADGIREAIENKELAKQKAAAAYEASKFVTFEYKTKDFLEFFERLK